MGCGKSKHDVATGNTIARKKSNGGDQSKKTKDIETVLENGTKNNEITNSSLVQQQEGDNQNVNYHNVGGDNNPEAEVRDIAENKAFNEGDLKEKQGGGVDQEKHEPDDERLMSKESPNHYFSSRKEDEAVDGIVSEQKSDYDSPRLEAVKESLFDDNEKVNNAVETTSLDEQEQGETKTVVKEENSAKEAEVSTPPTTDSVEKNQNAEKERSVASPTKDLKTV